MYTSQPDCQNAVWPLTKYFAVVCAMCITRHSTKFVLTCVVWMRVFDRLGTAQMGPTNLHFDYVVYPVDSVLQPWIHPTQPILDSLPA
jgi:hypothetical protein